MNPEVQNAANADRLISDEWLVAYAAGNLSEAKATLVATHASFHPELKAKISDAEDIAGAMLGATQGADLSDGFFDRLMAQIDEQGDTAREPVNVEAAYRDPRVPQPLADYLEGNLDELKWRFMGPGMKQVKLWAGENGEKLWLLKAKGGTEIPEHGHNGNELTLVLQGGYKVDGTHYTVGDLEVADGGVEDHRPLIDDGEDCICLVVTEAPIKLKGTIARAVQPFIGL